MTGLDWSTSVQVPFSSMRSPEGARSSIGSQPGGRFPTTSADGFAEGVTETGAPVAGAHAPTRTSRSKARMGRGRKFMSIDWLENERSGAVCPRLRAAGPTDARLAVLAEDDPARIIEIDEHPEWSVPARDDREALRDRTHV